MKKVTKRVAAFMVVTVMTLGIAAATSDTVLANDNVGFISCPSRGMGRAMGGMMWDEDGNFITREAFEERLDAWILDGIITSYDRESMLERFNWCSTYGGGILGRQGDCGNFGGGRGMRRWR